MSQDVGIRNVPELERQHLENMPFSHSSSHNNMMLDNGHFLNEMYDGLY